MNECESPIFIVGGSRSGTSLLAAMLNAHSNIACGTETQILNKIRRKRIQKIVDDPHWPNEAVKHLSNISLANQRVIDNFNISIDELKEVLGNHPAGVAALFEAIAGLYAYRQGKSRWAEKTPRHLLYVDILRATFPNAKIIRIMRDPRDSAISMCQLPWASDQMLTNFYIALDWYNQTDEFFDQDKNSITVVYEDLVKQPEPTLKSICEFIDETFEPGMLDTSRSGNAVATKNEHWKKQVSGPLDSNRLYRWTRELDMPLVRASTFAGYDWIKRFDYPADESPINTIYLYGFERSDFEDCIESITKAALKGTALPLLHKDVDPDNLIICLHSGKKSGNLMAAFKIILSRALRRKKTGIYVSRGAYSAALYWIRPFVKKLSSNLYEICNALTGDRRVS